MMLTRQSAQEFSKARQQAVIEMWLSRFKGRPHELLPFHEIKHQLKLDKSIFKGLRFIELNRIVGSVGRYRDFSRTFLPRHNHIEQRWRQVDTFVHEGPGFPPIEVFQVGDVFFVLDGHHRVSVARMHGMEAIEAYVTEYQSPVPVDNQDDLDDFLQKVRNYGKKQD